MGSRQYRSLQIGHCIKHGVSIEEIEEALISDAFIIVADPRHSSQEQRQIAAGTLKSGRGLFVAFKIRNHGIRRLVRPVSARYMHQKEMDRYEQARTRIAEQ